MILKDHFEYDFHRFTKQQKELLKMMSNEARAHNGNEYDLAVNFMVTMVSTVDDRVTHGDMLKKWIHVAAGLVLYMNIEEYKKTTLDVLKQINREVR